MLMLRDAEPPEDLTRKWRWSGKAWEDTGPIMDCEIAARQERGRLLKSSDWTQLPDVPLATKEAWAAYRQALRDITEQPGFPETVTWPTPPG